MSSREYHEYSSNSSNVVRSLNPNRPLSPPQKHTEYNNNNLDEMLDDLKTTVNKTTEHLNTLNSTKSRDVQFLAPANTTTVVEERTSSPIDGRKLYKSSRYEYSSSSTKSGGPGGPTVKSYESVEPSANISQLDSLLSDLKQERVVPFDKENIGFDSKGISNDSSERIIKTTHTRTTTTNGLDGTPKPVRRELKFDSPTLVSSVLHENRGRQRSRSPDYQKNIESQVIRDVTYDTEPVLDPSPNSTAQRTYYAKTSTRSTPYNTQIVEVDTTDLPAELKNAPISSDLLPGPGTKVTTTIKTFTYEIPDDTKVPTNQNFSYKNEYYNESNSSRTFYPERDVPPPITTTTSYSNESHNNTLNRINGPSVPMNPENLGPNQTYFYKKEVNETKNNIYGAPRSVPPSINETSIYERNVTDTRNVIQPRPVPPPINETSIYERNVTDTRNVIHPPGGIPASLPPVQPGGKQMYMYKKETTNTTNTMYEPEPVPTPEPTTNTYYKYSSTSTTNRTEPRVAPFPIEGIQQPSQVDGTPKHLNQLLASLDDGNGRIDDEPYVPRKEVNTALATNKNIPVNEPKAPTKNVAGPPVYYPPGQELFGKSEAQAAWRAQGGYAKGRGNYEYEAESKSKRASKSGAAVVPVCLPLCCAMPCSIM